MGAIVTWPSGQAPPHHPYRDWILSRGAPKDFDDLVIESQLRHRFSLFGVLQDASTQTDDNPVNFEYVRRQDSPDSHASSVATFDDVSPRPIAPVTPRHLAPWPQPVHSPPNQVPVLTVNHIPVGRPRSTNRAPTLLNPRDFQRIPRGPPPRLAIEGHAVSRRAAPPPVEAYPAPPTRPPFNAIYAHRGIRFLFTAPAWHLRSNPEVSVPRPIAPTPPIDSASPETNPEE